MTEDREVWCDDDSDPIERLQRFIDEKWKDTREHLAGVPGGPRVPAGLSQAEACWFLEAICPGDDGDPLLFVAPDGSQGSKRYPLKAHDQERAYRFFLSSGRPWHEGLVQWAAAARLVKEFRWPRDRLVCESPPILDGDRGDVLHQDALDILLLRDPCEPLPSTLALEDADTRVGGEVKVLSRTLDALLAGIRACQAGSPPPGHKSDDHSKCRALNELKPELFLGVAGGDDWRLFSVRPDGSLGAKRPLDDLCF